MWRSLVSLLPHSRKLTSNTMTELIKTFVFLDLETTGLPQMEHNRTKITELCAIAVQADHIELGCFPRVHNKLSFCFNPNKMIHPQSTDITGLSNELLEHQVSFSNNVVEILNKFLEVNKKPVCFVAHNGNRFDYPILRAEVDKTGNSLCDDLLCIDSLNAFRSIDKPSVEVPPTVASNKSIKQPVPVEFEDGYDELLVQLLEEYEGSGETNKISPEEAQAINETTPKKQIINGPNSSNGYRNKGVIPQRNFSQQRCFTSYKLGDVYSRLTQKEPMSAHEAEADVVMLLTSAAVLGEKFVKYANENSVKFSEIPPMKPGKKLGT